MFKLTDQSLNKTVDYVNYIAVWGKIMYKVLIQFAFLNSSIKVSNLLVNLSLCPLNSHTGTNTT